MKTTKNSENVTREELNKRVRLSKEKADLINITLPKGSKDLLIELTGQRPATACHDIIIEYIKRMKKL